MFGLGARIDSILGQGAEFRGHLSVEGSVVVDGRVEGNVNATERITIGAHGSVRGNLSAPEVIVSGKLHGHVLASTRAELMHTAVVDGDLRAPRVVLAEGATLNGKVGTLDRAQAEGPVAEYKFARK